jgi:hypothetical protein
MQVGITGHQERQGVTTGVSAEVTIAQEEKKDYFLLAGYADKNNKRPKAAKDADKMYKWTWDNLKTLIGGGR